MARSAGVPISIDEWTDILAQVVADLEALEVTALSPGTYLGASPEAQSVKRPDDPAVAYIVVAEDGTVTRFYGTL